MPETRALLPYEHDAVRRILNDERAVILGWDVLVQHLMTHGGSELALLIDTVQNLGTPKPITYRLSDAVRVEVFPLPHTTNIGMQIQCSKYCIATATFKTPAPIELISRDTEFSEYAGAENDSATISRAMYCALFLPDADLVHYKDAFQAKQEECRCEIERVAKTHFTNHWTDERWKGCRLVFNRRQKTIAIMERGDENARIVYTHHA